MPSHIYRRVGDYGAALRGNQRAIRVDRNYRTEQPDMPAGVIGYANHNFQRATLAASIAAARGDPDAAIAHWRDAVAIQDQTNPDDLPDWFYPVRESSGAALLGNQQATHRKKSSARISSATRDPCLVCTKVWGQQKSYGAAVLRRDLEGENNRLASRISKKRRQGRAVTAAARSARPVTV